MAEKEKNPSTTLGASTKSDAALREEHVLEFWKENKIFEKSLEQTEGKKEFIFYDGPVTSNSKPVLHTMEPFSFKDVIPRYKTMQHFHVRRKGGWDTHGLPVELQIEKKLGFKSKNDIENYGIAAFNKLCRESVWEYIELWKNFTERMGYWADQKNAYVTCHNDYIESVWNIVQKINERNLLYKDYKVVPWCPRCETTLSSHELAQGYENVKDLSVTVKFKIKSSVAEKFSRSSEGGQPDTRKSFGDSIYILAWTTTPWTLPGNVALAVGKDIDYVKIKKENEFLILAKERLGTIDGQYKIVEKMKGRDLLGLEYEPLYSYLAENISPSEKPKMEKAYKVYEANFVTTVDGTGVVHTAVMYGQDDFELGTQIGLPKHHLVGLDGKFLPGTGPFAGRFVRDEEVAVDIIKDLAGRGLLLKKEKYEHSYPHCWRCHTALIYYARDSWYIRMSDPKIKKEMIAQNEKINWEPAHIRDGRFGEWLREIKDWAVSRERYWGTPLPVWICESCKKIRVIGSIQDLKEKTKKSGNKYFVMRHGEAESNLKGMISSRVEDADHLTENGKKEVLNYIPELKNKKIDLIISSDFIRTKETAEIIKKELGISDDSFLFDKRIRELSAGVFEGKTWNEFFNFKERKYWYAHEPQSGESGKEVKARMMNFLYDLENKYKNKNILIVGHEGPIRIVVAGVNGLNDIETEEFLEHKIKHISNTETIELPFVPLPHNENYELDLHRPYIDEMNLVCSCGGNLVRVKEVMDVWFDSGAMPFAQDHYPFDPIPKQTWYGAGNKKSQKLLYPADFISEAIDQTRGWFYTLHAIGILMGRGRAYKNVICLGHLLDAAGKKMSKSLGNVVDPWEAMDKYGVDTLRLWMYSVNQPGESKNFDEKTVALLHQQVFGLLYNVLAFYELYRDKDLESREKALPLGNPRQGLEEANVLDVWILTKLDELLKIITENLDNYRLLEPTRAIKDFIGDLSTWYLRRSRERIKNGEKEAKLTLYFVLKNLAKILAPFAPFSAEDIWLKLKNGGDEESVHLTKWPTVKPSHLFGIIPLPNLPLAKGEEKEGVLEDMKTVRKIVSLGLEARQKAGIKVRQPLAKLEVKNFNLGKEYIELIQNEINVKEVKENKKIDGEVLLDTKITPELKQEGDYRELARALQDLRKKMGLTPSDIVALSFETDEVGEKLIQKFEKDLKKTVLVSKIEFIPRGTLGIGIMEEIKIDEFIFKVKIEK